MEIRREDRGIGEMEGGKEGVKEECRRHNEEVQREGIHCIPGSLYSINLHGNRVQL